MGSSQFRIQLHRNAKAQCGGDDEGRVLGIWKHSFGGVVKAKVASPIDNDSLDGHAKATIQAEETVRLESFPDAVK